MGMEKKTSSTRKKTVPVKLTDWGLGSSLVSVSQKPIKLDTGCVLLSSTRFVRDFRGGDILRELQSKLNDWKKHMKKDSAFHNAVCIEAKRKQCW